MNYLSSGMCQSISDNYYHPNTSRTKNKILIHESLGYTLESIETHESIERHERVIYMLIM